MGFAEADADDEVLAGLADEDVDVLAGFADEELEVVPAGLVDEEVLFTGLDDEERTTAADEDDGLVVVEVMVLLAGLMVEVSVVDATVREVEVLEALVVCFGG